MTSGKETERVYSYNPGARTGLSALRPRAYDLSMPLVMEVFIICNSMLHGYAKC